MKSRSTSRLKKVTVLGGIVCLVLVTIGILVHVYYRQQCVPIQTPQFIQHSQIYTPAFEELSTKIRNSYPTYKRVEDNSFLSLPEWYIVYSAHEFADFIKENNPSKFPYLQSIVNFWQYYCSIYAYTTPRYPVNADGYDMALQIIGTSYTFDYLIKGLYETTIGKISELFGDKTVEDHFYYEVENEYAHFLHLTPFYEFPYKDKYVDLWKLPLFGPNMIRKIERKHYLSSQYAFKAGYGYLILKGTRSVYAPEIPEILAIVKDLPDDVTTIDPQIQFKEDLGNNTKLVLLPRYEPFTEIVKKFSTHNIQLLELAGNRTILVSALTQPGSDKEYTPPGLIFSIPIATNPSEKRMIMVIPVSSLVGLLPELEHRGIKTEHIYDY